MRVIAREFSRLLRITEGGAVIGADDIHLKSRPFVEKNRPWTFSRHQPTAAEARRSLRDIEFLSNFEIQAKQNAPVAKLLHTWRPEVDMDGSQWVNRLGCIQSGGTRARQ